MKKQRPFDRQTFPALDPLFATDAGAQAAHRLFEWCGTHIYEGTSAIAGFLVNLYNSRWTEMDISYLRRCMDESFFNDVVLTMQWDTSTGTSKLKTCLLTRLPST
jgi:hypothetical protein